MKVRSENAIAKAKRVLPVLVYYAHMGRTLTYGQLGEITGDHHRSFRAAFGLIHEWIEKFAKERAERPLPLAVIVVQQGKSLPGAGAIRWRLAANRLSADVDQSVINLLFKDEHRSIFRYPDWRALLQQLRLTPYFPIKKSIDEVTKELVQEEYGTEGESEAHRRLKYFISANPLAAGLPLDCSLEGVEYVLPSLDRVDVMFKVEGVMFAVEVKSHEAKENEIIRGFYQVIKYEALCKALQRDRNFPPLAQAFLVTSAILTQELRDRARLLEVPVIEGVSVPKQFRALA